ncbi:MAG: KEOPS complex subunit Pcc1 [Candidatus Micrarchaeia archaeon]
MKNSAELTIEVPEKEAKSIIAALKKENASNKRFSSTIYMRAGKLMIRVEAEDMVALRSTLNSYLRYLQAIEEFEQKFPGD